MNKLTRFGLSVLTLVLVPALGSAADRVGDFALLDHQGNFHHMSWYDDHSAIALLVQANGSETTAEAAVQFSTMKSRYEEQGIEFFMINATGETDRASVNAELARYGVDIPVLMDETQIISRNLGIERAGEVLVYHPGSFTVEFRGPAGAEFEQALTAILAGEPVATPLLASRGAEIDYSSLAQHADLSYEKDIAPIIAENCASCHREGGIAPFAMDSHAMVQGWSPMIREVLMTKRMPPGQIDPHVGEFINDMTLDVAETQKVIEWIDAGSVKDGTTDPLAELTWPDSKWAFGEPDYIIEVPEQSIPATGVLDYRNVVVPIDIEKDRWVRGSQYVAGDRTVLHHTLNQLIPPDAERNSRGGFVGGGDPDAANITAYIPGAQPRLEPPNTGGLLKAGSQIALQLHYTTNGRETVDNSEIGLWFYPEGEVPEERMSGQCACIFTPDWTNIEPYDPAFEMSQTVTLSRDIHMHSFTPHMHFRGKSMRFFADYPDGNREELINIAKYNYNWQLAYTYAEPKFMPAGTVITAEGVFDNSTQNPANPDPARSVPWGQQSWDEMFFGAMNWKYTQQGGSE
ncbi:MAG: hypothetical protein WDZ76_10880 [Pseudohongiellaceae bacterium]